MCDIGVFEKMVFRGAPALPITAWKVFWKRCRCKKHQEQYSSLYQTQHEEYLPRKEYAARTCTGLSALIDATPDTGFWCFKTRKEARAYHKKKSYIFNRELIVKKVLIYGHIAQHQLGYRSKYMQIIDGR